MLFYTVANGHEERISCLFMQNIRRYFTSEILKHCRRRRRGGPRIHKKKKKKTLCTIITYTHTGRPLCELTSHTVYLIFYCTGGDAIRKNCTRLERRVSYANSTRLFRFFMVTFFFFRKNQLDWTDIAFLKSYFIVSYVSGRVWKVYAKQYWSGCCEIYIVRRIICANLKSC